MFNLPNDCRCSAIAVSPKNWDKKEGTTQKLWKIHYRFYSPDQSKPYQVVIKTGINYLKDLAERRAVVRELIRNEYHKLQVEGYNPFLRTFSPLVTLAAEILPDTLFIDALKKALVKMDLDKDTKDDINGIIRGVEKAARQLNFCFIPISDIGKRHLRLILEQCRSNSNRFTPNRYNAYRSYLIMLFKQLITEDTIEANPASLLPIQKVVKKHRTVLTSRERETVNDHLQKVDYRFWLFIQIFFHSGSRIKELVQLKRLDVDLESQKFHTLVKKRRVPTVLPRTIKNEVLPYWKEFMEGADSEQYLFGVDFLPAAKAMIPNTITRRWRQRVKIELGINADLYSLKHLNTKETVDQVGDELAALQNGHTSVDMVKKVYDVGRSDREHERLKAVNNKFA